MEVWEPFLYNSGRVYVEDVGKNEGVIVILDSYFEDVSGVEGREQG